jgi:Excreted virulence factor EspC, type VII ESX diderm
VLVDPEVLRAFAAQVDAVAATISGLDVGSVATTAADGLPGSETQWAARQVGDHLGLAAKDIVKDITAMGHAVRGAGDRYEVDDAALAGLFKQLF